MIGFTVPVAFSYPVGFYLYRKTLISNLVRSSKVFSFGKHKTWTFIFVLTVIVLEGGGGAAKISIGQKTAVAVSLVNTLN